MNWFTDIWLLRGYVLPALDILLLAFLFYKGYQILVQTRAVQLVRGGVFVGLTYATAYVFDLRTLLWLLNIVAPSLVIGIAIIFQPELRKIFTRIGQGRWLQFTETSKTNQLDAVVQAAEVLSVRKRGALIAFVRQVGQKGVIETGTRLDSDISSQLLLSIFGFDTALHDGAVFIEGSKMVAAGCLLPLSDQVDIRRSFGTRHRAALGLVEESDAVVLVVSEETGAVSLAYDGNLYYDLGTDEVRARLMDLLNIAGISDLQQEEVTAFED
ncbi:MAG: TIGR00159 family protein [Spirochaetaceae bacterium]|nr:MAG: TIGR00159 family protein [Spirochaetaceae bacterium]